VPATRRRGAARTSITSGGFRVRVAMMTGSGEDLSIGFFERHMARQQLNSIAGEAQIRGERSSAPGPRH